MLIAPFMMQPGRGIALFFPLSVIRAPVSLKIFGSHKEFRRGIFRQVMHEALSVQPNRKASLHHQVFMVSNCSEMFPGARKDAATLSVLLHFSVCPAFFLLLFLSFPFSFLLFPVRVEGILLKMRMLLPGTSVFRPSPSTPSAARPLPASSPAK